MANCAHMQNNFDAFYGSKINKNKTVMEILTSKNIRMKWLRSPKVSYIYRSCFLFAYYKNFTGTIVCSRPEKKGPPCVAYNTYAPGDPAPPCQWCAGSHRKDSGGTSSRPPPPPRMAARRKNHPNHRKRKGRNLARKSCTLSI